MVNTDQLTCSICGGPIDIHPVSGWASGHNAEPVNDGRCCTACNANVVIPRRLRDMLPPTDREGSGA